MSSGARAGIPPPRTSVLKDLEILASASAVNLKVDGPSGAYGWFRRGCSRWRVRLRGSVGASAPTFHFCRLDSSNQRSPFKPGTSMFDSTTDDVAPAEGESPFGAAIRARLASLSAEELKSRRVKLVQVRKILEHPVMRKRITMEMIMPLRSTRVAIPVARPLTRGRAPRLVRRSRATARAPGRPSADDDPHEHHVVLAGGVGMSGPQDWRNAAFVPRPSKRTREILERIVGAT